MNKNTVTSELVAANMQDVFVTTIKAFDKPVTYVEVRMQNGFTIRETTTCVDPANYDENVGKEICLKRIEDKVWFLLGYALQDKLALASADDRLKASAPLMLSSDYKERFIAEYQQDEERYIRLKAMTEKWDAGQLNFTPTCPREIYDRQLMFMKGKLECLQERAKLESVDLDIRI